MLSRKTTYAKIITHHLSAWETLGSHQETYHGYIAVHQRLKNSVRKIIRYENPVHEAQVRQRPVTGMNGNGKMPARLADICSDPPVKKVVITWAK